MEETKKDAMNTPKQTHRFHAVKLPCTAGDIIKAASYLEGWWSENHGDTPHKVEADFTGGVRLSNELIFKISEATPG